MTTDIDTSLRAYGFYKRHDWMDSEIRDGLRFMQKKIPDNAIKTEQGEKKEPGKIFLKE